MLSLILAATLAQSGPVYQARSNLFEPKEPSSEFIFMAMHLCFNERGGFSPAEVPMCGCLGDATRFNVKQGTPNTSPTPEQRKRCEAALKPKPHPPNKPSNGKGGV